MNPNLALLTLGIPNLIATILIVVGASAFLIFLIHLAAMHSSRKECKEATSQQRILHDHTAILKGSVSFIPVVSGVGLIDAERQRQISEEGWTAEHDDAHDKGQMAGAAACYAMAASGFENPHCIKAKRLDMDFPVRIWPWADSWWKPADDDRVRELVKAGALIAAEIDRLQRIASADTAEKKGESA